MADNPKSSSSDGRIPLPYLSFDTLRRFIDQMGEGPLPPRVDRSLMAGMAGGTQTLLLAALSMFELVDDNRRVMPDLIHLSQVDVQERKSWYRHILMRHYVLQMELSEEQGTADQLAETFRALTGYNGSTLRKAITFYLNMAKHAEMDLSPFFRPPPQAPAGARRRRPTRAPAPEAQAAAADVSSQAKESKSIELVSGGRVTISCTVDFLDLSRSDREFVFNLVDALAEYEAHRTPRPDED